MRRLRSFTVTPQQYRLVAYAALIVCTMIVFTGAAVRVTGSGLGCPDWPRCDGTSLTPELSSHALIEFGNRLLTGVVGLPCLAAAILAWRRRPFRRDIALVALLLPLGVAAQAVLGGLTVIYGLDPSWVIGHFLLSMLLLIACVALAWKARYEPDTRPPGADRLTRWAIRGLVAFGGVTLAAGTVATAAGPHAGGDGTGDVVPRLDFKGAETFDWAIHQHGAIATVLGLAAVGIWFLARARRVNKVTQDSLTAVCVLLACQGFVGAAQYAMEVPATMVWIHVVLAGLTWLALLWAAASSSSSGQRAELRAPARSAVPVEAGTSGAWTSTPSSSRST
jgi:cytochrome c oxidase assembly protein subunit 15